MSTVSQEERCPRAGAGLLGDSTAHLSLIGRIRRATTEEARFLINRHGIAKPLNMCFGLVALDL